MSVRKHHLALIAGAALIAGLFFRAPRATHAQNNSPTPATIMAGIGTPVANGLLCNVGAASATSTSIYDQRDITMGNSLWRCKLLPDGATYLWQMPFTAPAATGTTAMFVSSSIIGLNSQTQTLTIVGATTSMGAFCVPIGDPGNAMLQVSGFVTAPNTVSVKLTNTSLTALTPNAVAARCFVL